MSFFPRILALIPARGGSKGVPRKNVRSLCGKPTIAYTIEEAISCQDLFHRVVVSTDDTEIANISREFGAETPFIRPRELAEDASPMLPVVQHAAQWIEKEDRISLDWVCLLQPAAPLRLEEDIRGAINYAQRTDCDSVISCVRVQATHPVLMKKINADGFIAPFCVEEKEGTRRQDLNPPAYMRNGAIYLTKRETIFEQNSLWGGKQLPYLMPEERSLGIDSEIDFRVVEQLISSRR